MWAFGVVLLELLTGLEPIDVSRAPAQRNLVEWLLPLLPNAEAVQVSISPAMFAQWVQFTTQHEIETCLQTIRGGTGSTSSLGNLLVLPCSHSSDDVKRAPAKFDG